MALDTMDKLVEALGAQPPPAFFYSEGLTPTSASSFQSLWRTGRRYPGNAPADPPTGAGEAPTRLTAGAMPMPAPVGGKSARLLEASAAQIGAVVGTLFIYDRLVHTSGINANLNTLQAVNTAALTRYTSGDEVELWGEVYTQFGATPSTITVNYTDASGTARAFTSASGFNGSLAGRLIQLAGYQAHMGVRSVQSVQHSAAMAAGSWGITLMHRLAAVPIPQGTRNVNTRTAFDLGFPTIQDDACLALMWLPNTTTVGSIMGDYAVGLSA